MSKMTDEDIKKALERYIRQFSGGIRIDDNVRIGDVLDLINRVKGDAIHYRRKSQNQKQELSRLNAEIERLQVRLRKERHQFDDLGKMYSEIRAEVIKELEAKIHEKLHEAEMHGNFEPVVTREMFDSVVKELVGEQG